jgi:acetylornithine deacetylase/succinyl-diaminopimelate desuccinylase-like protein
VALVEGGTKVNIVPDRCRLQIDVRTVPAQNSEELQARLERLVRGVAPDAKVDCFVRKPLYTDPGHELVRLLEETGGRPAGAPWFSDSAVFAEAGIPSVALGPGSVEQAHTRDEWIAVRELERGADFFRRFLEKC